MNITSHRQHKIYLGTTMGYGLGSNELEEIAYFNEIKANIRNDKNKGNM